MGACGKHYEYLKVKVCVCVCLFGQWEIPQSEKALHSTQTYFEIKDAAAVNVFCSILKDME